jgi:hypothetical protein
MDVDEPPPSIVEPQERFRALSVADVAAALAGDEDHTNPVGREIERLIEGYARNLTAEVQRPGSVPASLLRLVPHWPIEAVAMRLLKDSLRDAMQEAEREQPSHTTTTTD